MIDGKAVAAAVRERVKVDVAAYVEEAGRVPALATVLVGDDPPRRSTSATSAAPPRR